MEADRQPGEVECYFYGEFDTCDRWVTPGRLGTYQYLEGWTVKREGGGAHAVDLAIYHQRWAHKHCIDKAKRLKKARFVPGQQALL